ncbi:ATP-binding protein [Amycolatopsis sp. CA-230715]|uniref:ATP-binding protein n=1 Tax=Amycolatopsis sp. CA-230715 TaxID=2745196 RepID=UPI001C025167|nr:ATP-binding protein [Amycolatopsis sp. CA-230715]QWF80090.1 Anti-sigma-F factor RsbW [Amycolatopsis sp. CA-230715]
MADGTENGSTEIELRLPADLAQLPIIRGLASTISTREDFDLDAIADLRLAVDEAASTLITRAAPGSTMICTFALEGDELRFTGRVLTHEQEAPSTGTFGWRVLATLTDSATGWVSGNGQGNLLHIQLAKRKPVART